MSNRKARGGGKRTALIVLCVVLALLLVVLVSATVYLETLFGRLGRDIDESLSPEDLASIFQKETVPADFSGPNLDDVTMPSGPVATISQEDTLNILLVGQDDGRSDAMILATFNPKTKTITLTSFLRDMYVTIPGYYDDKLNHSYAYGLVNEGSGFRLLNETLAYNFGVQIDGNVGVGFESFQQVIDMLGGVDVDLTEEEAQHMAYQLGADISASGGVTHLNGANALRYARIRKLDSDFGRTNRQRTVLEAIFNKVKGMGVTELNDLLMDVLPLVKTDMSNSQIMGYALEVFPLLLDCKMVTQQIPADGTWEGGSANGLSVLFVDFAANRDILHETLGD